MLDRVHQFKNDTAYADTLPATSSARKRTELCKAGEYSVNFSLTIARADF